MQLDLHIDDVEGAGVRGRTPESSTWRGGCVSAPICSAPSLQQVRTRLQSAYGALAPWRRRDGVSQLVRSLIAARTQDAVSDAVLMRLRERFRAWGELAQARPDEVLAVIGAVTYPERKARHLPLALRAVIARAGALRLDGLEALPLDEAMAWLQGLPGVGQKTAASVLNFSLGLRVMVVDGHVLRVAVRLGLAPLNADADAAREAIMAAAPGAWDADALLDLHRRLKRLGQTACRPHGPACGACPLSSDCPDAARRRSGALQADAPPSPGPSNGSQHATDATDAGWLRRQVARIERSGPAATVAAGGLAPEIDAVFTGGGLPAGLHQVAPAAAGDLAAPLLLALALAARPTVPSAAHGPGVDAPAHAVRLLLAAEGDALREGGCAYGPGLAALGAAWRRTAFARAPDAAAALRIVEEAVRLNAAPVAVVELRRGAALADLDATRRLDLLARRAGVFVFLITPTLDATSAATTRWRVGSRPSRARRHRLGAPAFSLHLVRNRRGRTGEWSAQWSAHERRFVDVAPLSAPVGAPVLDRPRATGVDAVAAAA